MSSSEDIMDICLIGMGTVGRRFLELLHQKRERLEAKFNFTFRVIAICEIDGALIDEEGLNLDSVLNSEKDFRQISEWKEGLKAPEVLKKYRPNLCVESTPTNPDTGEPALTHIKISLRNKIDVVASNKGPFCLKYSEIKNLAEENNCYIKHEATVVSGVPVLSIKDCLMGNEIKKITAILNGTCNYILSRMTAEGVSFSLALKEAQELGYAETDPTLDIEGYDAAGKIVILANILLGWSKSIEDVTIRGITKVTPQAIELAKADGFLIKHLAIAEDDSLIVEPRLIKKESRLNVSGTLNAVKIQTDSAGPIFLMGRGAGGYEAASALLNDLLSIAKKRGFANRCS
ncbi:MAG: homoserine dehydrogenase [Promethearchaeia archaeon]